MEIGEVWGHKLLLVYIDSLPFKPATSGKVNNRNQQARFFIDSGTNKERPGRSQFNPFNRNCQSFFSLIKAQKPGRGPTCGWFLQVSGRLG